MLHKLWKYRLKKGPRTSCWEELSLHIPSIEQSNLYIPSNLETRQELMILFLGQKVASYTKV